MADGYTRQKIAGKLNLSPETIKSHSKTILGKFAASTFREAYADIHNYLKYFSLNQSTGRYYWARLHRSLTIAMIIAHPIWNIMQGAMLFVVKYLNWSFGFDLT